MRELSWLAILLGVVIGAALAAANAFVGLKVGMTVSASIPAAVMSLLVLRTLLKRGTLLESNMVQTIGSAGESVAAGMIFTLPALFIMESKPEYLEMVIWGGLGGLLGVCFMVPLRQVLIVREHGTLPYPEGVACAEVLQSGERGGAGAKSVIWGSIVGGVYFLVNGLGFWRERAVLSLDTVRTEVQLDSSPAMLGVGYILGPRIAGYMLGGAVLSWFVLIPGVAFFGADAQQAIYPVEDKLVSQMSPYDIYKGYVRHIGAGAVAIGGLISLFKSMPTILSSMWHLLSGMFGSGRRIRVRTDKDIPFPILALIIGGLAYAMWSFEAVRLDHIGVIAVIIFTFFFVTVSARLVGIVGSSSNPVSGMTIATLLGTALVYKFFVLDKNPGMTEADLTTLKITCMSIGAIVCTAITIGGDTSQDLKTGFLVKATPYKQQIGEMIGVLTSVVAIAGLLLLLNDTYGFTQDKPNHLPAFQANIMKIIVEGVLGGQVPWTLIMMGGAAAVVVEMLGLPALPFAVGMYLPLGLSTPIMAGGVVRWLIARKHKDKTEHDPGVLTASGLVAGYGLMGVTFAGVLALIAWGWSSPTWTNPFADGGPATEPVAYSHLVPWLWQKMGGQPVAENAGVAYWYLSETWWKALPAVPFALLTIWLWWCARKRPPIVPPRPVPSGAAPDEPTLPSMPTILSDSSHPGGSAEPPAEGTEGEAEPASTTTRPESESEAVGGETVQPSSPFAPLPDLPPIPTVPPAPEDLPVSELPPSSESPMRPKYRAGYEPPPSASPEGPPPDAFDDEMDGPGSADDASPVGSESRTDEDEPPLDASDDSVDFDLSEREAFPSSRLDDAELPTGQADDDDAEPPTGDDEIDTDEADDRGQDGTHDDNDPYRPRADDERF